MSDAPVIPDLPDPDTLAQKSGEAVARFHEALKQNYGACIFPYLRVTMAYSLAEALAEKGGIFKGQKTLQRDFRLSLDSALYYQSAHPVSYMSSILDSAFPDQEYGLQLARVTRNDAGWWHEGTPPAAQKGTTPMKRVRLAGGSGPFRGSNRWGKGPIGKPENGKK